MSGIRARNRLHAPNTEGSTRRADSRSVTLAELVLVALVVVVVVVVLLLLLLLLMVLPTLAATESVAALGVAAAARGHRLVTPPPAASSYKPFFAHVCARCEPEQAWQGLLAMSA